jgi:monooxygenase
VTAPLPVHVDVLVVGAGLSGIGAACHLAQQCPDRKVLILDGRDAIGGTWDLFRYPGVRSDSDMNTLGYGFRPWSGDVAIADGPSILKYIRETAEEFGVLDKVRLGHRVLRADWDGTKALWTVDVASSGVARTLTCSFLYLCTGYYDYDQGYTPDFAVAHEFAGTVVHPQHWPQELEDAGKRVVVIGSGATAVTLVPALAETSAHVTMLQRSPTYIVSAPRRDSVAAILGRVMPEHRIAKAVLWKNVLLSIGQYEMCRRFPKMMARLIRADAARRLPAGYDVDTHFRPRYKPWDQRVCLAPDGDFFAAVSSGKASIVTDQVDRLEAAGVRLTSGGLLEADIVVTATGLNMLALGGIVITVDGEKVDVGSTTAYKAMMICGVPNLAWTVGYTNASWTLKADLVARYVCRLLNHMSRHGYSVAEPMPPHGAPSEPLIDLTSGYVQRGINAFPKQGPRAPWRLRQNYLMDVWSQGRDPVDDHIRLSTRPARSA